jgi:uncharacterized protein (DUF2384 family)
MNYSLNKTQIDIVSKLQSIVGEELDTWLSMPHKAFRNKAPIELLLAENYDYFYLFITAVK